MSYPAPIAPPIPPRRQRGNIFLFFALIFITVFMGILVGQLLPSNNQPARASADQQVLASAANGILNWGMSHPSGALNAPTGMLPYPNIGPPTGFSVCPAGAPLAANRLGYFPYIGESAGPPATFCRSLDSTPRPWVGAMDLSLHDSSGSLIWYAVAAPVMDNRSLAPNYPSITPAALTAAANQLFTVCDANGNATSNVVFVVFAPGPALTGQNRAAAGTATNFLDSANLAGAAPCNGAINNSNIGGGVFVAGNLSDTFNDQLSYVTLHQYLDRLVPAVMQQAVKLVDSYHQANGAYPGSLNSTFWPAWDANTPSGNRWQQTVQYQKNQPTVGQARLTIPQCPSSTQFTLTWGGSSSIVTPAFSSC